MKRPVGVIVTAIVQLLGSLLVLLFAVGTLVLPHIVSGKPAQPPVPSGFFVVIGLVYLVAAALGIGTAGGVFCLQRWSRYSTLAFAGLIVFVGLILTVVFVLLPFPASPQAQLPSHFAIAFKSAMALIQLSIVLLGAWWLYYFTRKPIADAFVGRRAGPADDCRPLSVTILAVLSLFSLPWMLLSGWLSLPVLALGVVVHGTAARLIYLTFLALQLYIGIGLWRLWPKARGLAVGFYAFGIVNTLASQIMPGRDARYQQVVSEFMRIWHLPNVTAPPPNTVAPWIGAISAVAFSAIAIYFLITRGAAFRAVNISNPTA